MATSITPATLDTNNKGAVTSAATLTTETQVGLYVYEKTGTAGKYRVGLEFSPDAGATWVEGIMVLAKPGILICQCVATQVRVKVIEAQDAASTVTVHLLAR